ncbi:hypothetical protein QYE76_033427 [Lolium multiflorum]|uniref:DUF8039 domain-containing protein n=1 Tax=Lolium multiflorum TaxID=4521 RepID=A0AAD8VKB1_LOLMU|nr:hypothetical protein QYE76_033427 [Lolium multiflorum]
MNVTDDEQLYLLAKQPSSTISTFQGYEINGNTFYTFAQDKKSTNQNSGVRFDAEDGNGNKVTYYGYIEEIWELDYGPNFKVPLFRCKWFNLKDGVQVDPQYGMTTVDFKNLGPAPTPSPSRRRRAHAVAIFAAEPTRRAVAHAVAAPPKPPPSSQPHAPSLVAHAVASPFLLACRNPAKVSALPSTLLLPRERPPLYLLLRSRAPRHASRDQAETPTPTLRTETPRLPRPPPPSRHREGRRQTRRHADVALLTTYPPAASEGRPSSPPGCPLAVAANAPMAMPSKPPPRRPHRFPRQARVTVLRRHASPTLARRHAGVRCTLDLSMNSFVGPAPFAKGFAGSGKLPHLSLEGNNFSGPIPLSQTRLWLESLFPHTTTCSLAGGAVSCFCGYKSAIPKWTEFENKLMNAGITPQTWDWPERSKFWLFAHGAGLDPKTGLIVAKGKWKEKIEEIVPKLITAIEQVRKGEYIPDRENDELTLALGNPEHVGRVRARPGLTMKEAFPESADTYRSRSRKKKKDADELAELRTRVEALEKNQRAPDQQLFLQDPQADAAPSQRRSSVGSSHLDGCGGSYPVDYITEKTDCELHMLFRTASVKVAVGYVYPSEDGAMHHHMPIPPGCVRVGVDCFGF